MKEILSNVNKYYTEKIIQYGPSPQGADWRNEESQLVRFEQLLKINDSGNNEFSINDLGCGYGKLYEFLNNNYKGFRYAGYDLSKEMILAARELYGISNRHSFHVIDNPSKLKPADFTVASGIFNVKMEHSDAEWRDYILSVLKEMDRDSIQGFAFNCLTSYSDPEYMKDTLYYADPCYFFDYCKRHFSKNISLLHNYNLYEFTILVFNR